MMGHVTAVLGCGVIGSSWVEAFRAAGHRVRVWDPAGNPSSGRTVANVSWHETAREAVQGAQFVQESGPERLQSKLALFTDIEGSLPVDALVASSTSTLLASDLQQGCDFADRVLVGHPFNPPHVIPLVEVVAGAATAEWAVDRAICFYAALGKYPIHLRTERPGHLANRLQAALWREAVDSVASGQASVADVDAAVTLALGPRWALMGPFGTFALGGGKGGLAHFLDHLGAPFEALWDDARRPAMTDALKRQLVGETKTELDRPLVRRIRAERDARLREILAVAHGEALESSPTCSSEE